ncbi:GNAT family N-acetyltransferase [Agromyces sp. MMS24-K17]|uniref:GNAT family N-acetyltransferase n=1 Tax=Agromyces sp. MMS24-K17 TaxID=3372850 RepID=UPI0037551DCD
MRHPIPDGTGSRRLGPADAGELLTLQRAAYATEAQLYDDPRLPALTQTLDDLRAELAHPALGLFAGHRLVASVRWRIDGGTARIGRLVVAPDRQGLGLGTALLRAAEQASGAHRFALFTGHRSEGNLRLYEREGYRRVRREVLRPGVELVHLEKEGSRSRQAHPVEVPRAL